MEPSRDRPAFVSPDAPPQHGLSLNQNQPASELFPGVSADAASGPKIFANRAPVDLPDEFPGVVPEFVSRRKAEALPKLQPAPESKGFDEDAVWASGFWMGVFALLLGGAIGAALGWWLP